MFRILCVSFALAVAAMAVTIINTATQSAIESFRISSHHDADATR